MGVTERLYYTDSYLSHFTAEVLAVEDNGQKIYLNRTAFYPTSGGQLLDHGTLAGMKVLDVIDEGERIAHLLEQNTGATPVTGTVEGKIDWQRRFDHMQQHSGQHLLSAIFAENFGLETVSVHLGETSSTLDLDTPSIDPAILRDAELLANEAVCQNIFLTVSFEEGSTAQGLRKASERSGILRIVTIQDLDRSACGGTHVRATGEIGSIFLKRTEKIRQATRLEFVCGLRAIRSIRSELSEARTQASIVQTRLAEADKERKKLATELAGFRGQQRYQETVPASNGMRTVILELAEITDSTRQEAQAFIQGSKAAFVVISGNSALLAFSSDSGLHAGSIMKEIAVKGGGSATTAQGSLSDPVATLAYIKNKFEQI